MTKRIEWIDPARKDEQVETQAETAKRLGMKKSTLESFVRMYPDRFPREVAYLMPTRLRLRSVKELEEFFAWKASKPDMRSRAEVVQGKCVALTRSLETAERRLKKAQLELEEAQRDATRLRSSLRKEKEYLGLLLQEESGA